MVVSVRTCSSEIVGTPVDPAVEKSSCTFFADSGAGLVQVHAAEGEGFLDNRAQQGVKKRQKKSFSELMRTDHGVQSCKKEKVNSLNNTSFNNISPKETLHKTKEGKGHYLHIYSRFQRDG